MVVALIVGIIAGTAILTYSPPLFREQRAVFENLQDNISIAQERALLSGVPYGILFFNNKFIFLQIQGKTWQSSDIGGADIDLALANLVVDGLSIRLLDEDDDSAFFPQVVFLPTAEMTEFTLSATFNDREKGASIIFDLKSDILGRATLDEYKTNL